MSMGGRLRQLASETAIYGVSSILGRMLNFLLFPFYSNVFPPEGYGVVSVVYTALIFLNVVYQYGMESAYLKYASDAETPAERQTAFSTAWWSLLGTSLLLSGVLLLFRAPVGTLIGLSSTWEHLLTYAVLILSLDALATLPFAELRLQNQPWRFAAIRLINIGVNIGLNLYLILERGMGIEAVFLANIAASATSVVLLGPTFWSLLRPRFAQERWKALLRFGLPFLPGGLGYALADRVNIFFLSRLTPDQVTRLYGEEAPLERLQAEAASLGSASVYGDYVVGLFGGAMKLAVFMALLTQMFRFAWQPFFLQRAGDADAPRLFARVFTLFTTAALLVWLGVSFYAAELVAFPLPGDRTLVAPAYWPGLVIVPVALLGYVFQGWYYVFSAGAYLKEQTRYFVHCTLVGSVVALLLNAALVPLYGMIAAAWATTAAYATMAGLLHVLIRRHYRVPYEWSRVAGLVGIAVLILSAWHLVPSIRVWWIEGLLLLGFAGLAVPLSGATRRSLS